MTNIVTVYRADYSLRVTMPKDTYEVFEKINKELAHVKGLPPMFRLSFGKYGFDIVLELYLGKPDPSLALNIQNFGKTSKGFTLNAKDAAKIGIVAGSKLDCGIATAGETSPDCHNLFLGYKVLY